MPDAPTHELVIRGRLGRHLLGPFLDDFTVGWDEAGTRLTGTIRDASHLHGLVAFLASINAELTAITPLNRPTAHTPLAPSAHPRSTP
ncbi:MAG: hypothetical protein IT196_27105 [Acidimicrobiales bacterium]|nr:hypothetical protein [Acidimicrobiales bacterium]